tara:strand:+ start:1202 stop:1948 length:747 start_codon:yes stop_codon:yes gene_type:complete
MSTALIQADNLSIYYDSQCVLNRINVKIMPNQTTAFMGPSGVGKSSLLKALSGQISLHSGTINYNYKDPNREPLKTGILFQDNALLLHLTVFENVALPIRYHYNLPEKILNEIVMMKLHAVNLEHAADLFPDQLSGGMTRRAAIARSIALDPDLIFYDEPFAGQDPINAESIAKLIKKMNKHLDATSIIITHEVNLTLQLADYIYIFDKHSIAFQGSPQTVSKSKNPFVQAFINPSLKSDAQSYEDKT